MSKKDPHMCFNTNTMDGHNFTKGLFFQDNIIDYNMRIFPLQVGLIVITQSILQLVLKPLGQTPIVANILAGVILGTSGFCRSLDFQKTLIPYNGTYLPNFMGTFGCMIHFFLIGLKLDFNSLKISSKKERAIGFLTFIIPIMILIPSSYLLRKYIKDDVMKKGLPTIALLESSTSFHVIISFLADLEILNTELGRIATSASLISGMCSWVVMAFFLAMKQNGSDTLIPYTIGILGQVIFITVVLRKIVRWIIKQTPQGESIKEPHFVAIFLMILGTGFAGDVLGQTYIFGPTILGMVIPNGPPVASTLTDKLEHIVSGFLMPQLFYNIGVNTNFGVGLTNTQWIILFLSLLSIFGKIMGTIIPCLLFRIPYQEGVLLGLILSTLGIFDVLSYTIMYQIKETYINDDSYRYMVMNVVLVAGVIAPIVRHLYDPSRRYNVYKGRTIQNTRRNAELGVLVCIYNQDIVPAIINILEASNPTRDSPIAVYVLHLVELVGRSTPLVINHKQNKRISRGSTPSDHIINSFKIFEKRNTDAVILQPFTAFTPFVSAHDDICTVALEKRTALIIIPYHIHWNIDRTTHTCKWMNANKKVLKQAPCSVGILIDRREISDAKSVVSGWSTCNIGVIFLGGVDDREAVCYGIRMARHPNANVTVHRIVYMDNMTYNATEKMLDNNVLNDYRLDSIDSEHNHYKEEQVRDVVELISVIRKLEDAYDIILVGRRHDTYSTLLSGATEWNEHPELGFFGDLLVSDDFRGNFSLLVLQQHSRQHNLSLLQD